MTTSSRPGASESGGEPLPTAELVCLSPPRYKRHRFMLIVACAIVASAVVFRVPSNDRVELAGMAGLPMPSLCMSKSLLGIDCPGCGLTRSLLCFFQGQFARSLALHSLGWVIAVAVLLQFPYRILALVRKQDYPLGKWLPQGFGCALIVLLVANWVVSLYW